MADSIELRRRGLEKEPEELYPVGTAILSMYIGNKDGGLRRNFKSGYGINTSNGEYYATGDGSTYASNIYVPVNPKYSYKKNGYRLIKWAFYDKDKQFLKKGPEMNNLNVQTLEKFPAGTCYIRIQAFNYANQSIEITRTA